MIIGLTGKNGSGKGEAARFLMDAGYQYFSLSDEVRHELERHGIEVTRDSLTTTANEMREEFGAGVLAERTLEKLDPTAHAIVDSIRNPFEVETLRRRDGFYLLNVDADTKVRFERVKKRAREKDPTTYEKFLEVEAREAQSDDPASQQLNRTCQMADAVVTNNGTINDLHDRIREVINTLAMNKKRPDWDQYFMSIAKVVALRGNCIKRKVAAVIIKDKRVVSTGYNGTPRGVTNCSEGGCPRCNRLGTSGTDLTECLCSHAEENSIVQAAYHGVSIKGATMYSTYSPCLICTKMIINSGIDEVVFSESYSMDEVPFELLRQAGVTVRKIEDEG